MPSRIIGTANEVVDGNVVEVGKGDENERRRNNFPVFVALIALFGNVETICHLLLSKTTFEANLFELSIKRIHWVNLQNAKYEYGACEPTVRTAIRIADALHVKDLRQIFDTNE